MANEQNLKPFVKGQIANPNGRPKRSFTQAKELGLEIDHDDTHAYKGDVSFALLIHGSQPKGSEASNALQELKKEGWTGYTKKGEVKKRFLKKTIIIN